MSEIQLQTLYGGGPQTEADWTAANPLLAQFQLGFTKDAATGAITGCKIGDGVTRWTSLGWLVDPSGSSETTTTLGTLIHGATAKTTPVDADEVPIVDSAASNILKKVTWANIKATLKTYFDTLYPSGSGTSTGTNTGDQTISDATISLTDITTNDASTSRHGFLKKLDNNAAHFMNGQGAWATPSGGITNGAGSNVIPKSDGTNLIASGLSDDGTSATLSRYLKLTNAGAIATPQINFGTATTGIWGGSDQINFTYSGVIRMTWDFSNDAVRLSSLGQLCWSNTNADPKAVNDVGLVRVGVGILRISNSGSGNGMLQLGEVTAPSAPADTNVILYATDGGGGKTKLMAIFPSGAAQQIAIEP